MEPRVLEKFLATKIFEYAIHEQIIEKDAPFAILNCADYADNPELLSATLFGYKKGPLRGLKRIPMVYWQRPTTAIFSR